MAAKAACNGYNHLLSLSLSIHLLSPRRYQMHFKAIQCFPLPLDHDSTSEIGFEYEFDIVIPPPMSLSAPELGAEPPLFIPIRSSVSSTELLHERAMARFYQAVEAEEAEIQKRREQLERSERRKSADGKIIEIPKIQIIDEDPTASVERKQSLRRRMSGGTTAQQILWAQQKRQSLKNSGELATTDVLENKLHKFPDSLEARRELMMLRQRSASEEKEEEEFERVRRKMAEKAEQEKRDKLAEAQKKIDVAPVDVWEAETVAELEYEESLSSDEESEESEDERLKFEMTVPKYYADEEEDEIYHPRMMIPQQNAPCKSKSDEPFEILTKPSPLPDPNFVPKPILKRRQNLDDVANKDKSKSKKLSPQKEVVRTSSPSSAAEVPHKSPPRSKPKKTSPQKETTRPLLPTEKVFTKTTNQSAESKRSPPKSNEKQTEVPKVDSKSTEAQRAFSPPPLSAKRGSYGHIESTSVSTAAHLVGMSAAGVALSKSIPNKRVIEEENRTVIDHYGDLVRTYGSGKKPAAKPYWEREELQSAPEPPEPDGPLQSPTTVVEIAYTPVITKKEAAYTNETLVQLQESDIKTLEENRTRSPSPQKPLKKPLERYQSPEPTKSSQESVEAARENARRKSQETSSSQELLDADKSAGRRLRNPAKREGMRRSATPIRTEKTKRAATPVRTEPKRPVAPSPMRTERTYSRPSSTAPSPMRTENTHSRSASTGPSPMRTERTYTRTPSSSRQRKTCASPARTNRPTSPTYKTNSLPLPRPKLKEMTTQTSIGYDAKEGGGEDDRKVFASPITKDEIVAKAEVKVRTVMEYTTDLAMFSVACWLYLFSNELLALPVLAVMGYRQLKDEARARMPLWLKRKLYGANDK